VPIGPAGVTQRIIYRTKAGGSVFLYVGVLADNISTTFLDTQPDSALGRPPQTTSTIGALAGDTSLLVKASGPFPPQGWIKADSQLVRYSGVSAPTWETTTLTGIPSSGSGAILGAIAGGVTVLTSPLLTGVTGLTAPLVEGDSVHLWVVRNNLASQTSLALKEGGDGVHEFLIRDDTLDSVAACTARGDAELVLFATPQLTVTYATRDRKTHSGLIVTLALPAPENIVAALNILDVTIDQIDLADGLFPHYTVQASNVKFSLDDLLRHVVLA